MQRKIINKESFSEGKKEGYNDDAIYIGTNFVAVIDGVSHKSQAIVDGKQTKIAEIITNAIRKIDSIEAPDYAKELKFEDAVKYINMYISKYLQKYSLESQIGKLEATGVIYSKYHNQLWIVGDCKAMYDGIPVENKLKVDGLYTDIRKTLIQALLKEGYTKEELLEHDYSKDIIKNSDLLSIYIKNKGLREEIKQYRDTIIRSTLLECGFTEEEIESEDLVKKFYNPRDLQKDLKNNANRKDFGYSVFNGEYTEIKNCKVVDLPENVKTIKISSDGFHIEDLKENIAHAVKMRMRKAENDRLSIAENQATHSAVRYSCKESIKKRFATDDASAIIFEIEHIKEEPEKNDEVIR